jgi:site-specific recombinase XerD
MKKRPSELPETARRFLRSRQGRGKGGERIIRRFHDWMNAKHVALMGLEPSEVENFFKQPFRAVVTPRTAQRYKRAMIVYLDWLYKNGHIDFDPRCLGIRRRVPLPPCAVGFVKALAPTHKPSTCQGYESTLRNFHEWLDSGRVKLKRIKRAQIEQWFQALSDQGLHPITRRQAIIQVRIYLWWLFEREELRANPEDLIRSRDLPKLPSYLPRPLPPDVDAALQRSLEASRSRLCKGLLLMRQTGLRIGELASLEYDCVRLDPNNNRFLKVPLGKLDNERLVPITDQTYQLIQKLQTCRPPTSGYLLETASGKKVYYALLRRALVDASENIVDAEPITSHRLRHTYATSLLSAGMSLVGVMKLLGHRDFRMTLRYTAITQDTVGREYRAALDELQTKYGSTAVPPASDEMDLIKALADIIAGIHKDLVYGRNQNKAAQLLIKRLRRIQSDLQQLMGR